MTPQFKTWTCGFICGLGFGLLLLLQGCKSQPEPWYRKNSTLGPDPMREAERAMFEMQMARCAGLDVSIVECLYGI